ncbi:MAG: AbiJ-NTD4 domain-containing protein, partial [Ruminiclostridium sp.]
MSSFSERMGLKQIKNVIQVESMDTDLRNSIWNGLNICYFNTITSTSLGYKVISENYNKNIYHLIHKIWMDYFKIPVETIKENWDSCYTELKDYFFKCKWYEVYDFVEFIGNNYVGTNNAFISYCNKIFEREISGYRFVDRKIIRITEPIELDEIEEALKTHI